MLVLVTNVSPNQAGPQPPSSVPSPGVVDLLMSSPGGQGILHEFLATL